MDKLFNCLRVLIVKHYRKLRFLLFFLFAYFLFDQNNILIKSLHKLVENGLICNIIIFLTYIILIDFICLYRIKRNRNIFLQNKWTSIFTALAGSIFLPYEVIYTTNYNHYAFAFNFFIFIIGFCSLILTVANLLYIFNDRKFTQKDNQKAIIYYLIPCITISITWARNFPALLSFDSKFQLNQIAANSYNDIHPASHTLFCKLLMQIYDSPATVVFFQIVFMCIVIGYIFQYFHEKGISNKLLLPTLVVWSCLTPIKITTCYFWKDIFYAIALLFTTVFLVKAVESKGKIHFAGIFLSGVCLSAIFLFRHNGIVPYVFIVAVLVCLALKYKAIRYIVPVIVSLTVILMVKTVIYDIYDVQPNTDGTKYAIFGKAIVSVVANDGTYSQEELEQITQIMPVDVIKRNYYWSQGHHFLWNIKPEDNKYGFGNSLQGKGKFLVHLLFKLLPGNFMLIVWDVMGTSALMWQFDFIRINFFSVNMVYLFPILIFAFLLIKNKKSIGLIPFIPVLSNVLSIAISNTSYEARYGFPTIVISAALFIYTYYMLNKNKLQVHGV